MRMAATNAKMPRTILNSVLKTPQMNLNITVNNCGGCQQPSGPVDSPVKILEARGTDTFLSYMLKDSENK